ncbi:MAG: carbon storage regulator [Legionella sp.]|nr:carbon storage regulator [Legionella sp.]
MLVLTRRLGQQIVIGNGAIQLKILRIQGGNIRIGICAPAHIAVDREEVFYKKLNQEEAVSSNKVIL